MKNNKGFTVIELIVSFGLTMLVVSLLLQMLLSLKEIYVTSGVKSQLLTKQTIISSKINSDMESKDIKIALKCGANCVNFIFEDDTSSKLIIDRANNMFSYGEYTTKLVPGSVFGNVDISAETLLGVSANTEDSFIKINVPISHPQLKDDFGVHIMYQYDSRNSSITSLTFDDTPTTENEVLLKGAETIYITPTIAYTEPGYYTINNQGAITNNDPFVTVTGTVGSTVGSTYTLVYTYRDASSNILDTVSREVKVIPSAYTFGSAETTNYFTAQFDTTFDSFADGDTAGFTNQLSGGYLGVSTEQSYGSKSLKVQRGTGNRVYRSYALPINSNISFSVDVYSTLPGTVIRIELSGGSYTWNGIDSNAHTGSGWERLTVTYPSTLTSATTGYFFIYPIHGSPIYLDNIQIEPMAYSTPYSNGQRSGAAQIFSAPISGVYQVELWGASGGFPTSVHAATVGRGGYTKGNIALNAGDQLGVFVGGTGAPNGNWWNGGGDGEADGGGATDVRLLPKNKYRYVRDFLSGSTANTGNHWVEVEVYDKYNKNVAAGKPIRCSGAAWLASNIVTDGATASANYYSCPPGSNQWLEVDLGAEYEISRVNIRHYYDDSRTYFSTKTTLFNEDYSVNLSIFDSAWQGTYAEGAAGRTSEVYDWRYFDSLKTRIMVAGGGGGGVYNGCGGYVGSPNGSGGGLTGISANFDSCGFGYGYSGYGGTQTAGGAGGKPGFVTGVAGKFGIAGSTGNSSGGGGGYYGGGSGTHPGSSWTGGGGGSSFISGYAGSNAIDENGTHTNQSTHYSGKTFSNPTMFNGNQTMPSPSGGTQTGQVGNGYAKFTLISAIY